MIQNPFASIHELQKKIAAEEIAPRTIVEYYRERFKKYDAVLGSALEVFDTDSIIVDMQQGPLWAIPGLIKDIICQKARITSCASKIISNFISPYDATAVARLKKEGALMIGRGNCDEFAMGTSGEYSSVKPTANPWNLECVAGGSSSGSVAAVAAGLVPWALGSETGGSVRLPAAFCGVVGLKPTYGLVSRYGLVAYASSLDQIGVTTRTVSDTARIFSVIAGHDKSDSSTQDVSRRDYTVSLDKGIRKGLTIGVIDNMMMAKGIDPEISSALKEAIKTYEKMGATIKHVSLPALDYGAAVYFILSRAEAASNLARYDGVCYGERSPEKTLKAMYAHTRHDGFGDEVRMRILVGNYVLSAGHAAEFYKNAQKVQRLILNDFEMAFSDVDLLFAPVHAAPAFKLGKFKNNKLHMDLMDYFTCPANLAGIPAISIPCGFTQKKLPIGFQLLGPVLSEELLLQTAYTYEQAMPWHTMTPPDFK